MVRRGEAADRRREPEWTVSGALITLRVGGGQPFELGEFPVGFG
jgi:hypothetical protein